MLSVGINSQPAKGIMKTWKALRDPWLWVQMMENPLLKLLLEIQLLIRANKAFALPINLSNIKKQRSRALSPSEDGVFVIAVFLCSVAGIHNQPDHYHKNRFCSHAAVRDGFYWAFKTEALFQNPACCTECKGGAALFDWSSELFGLFTVWSRAKLV